jgi:hypothetical protein
MIKINPPRFWFLLLFIVIIAILIFFLNFKSSFVREERPIGTHGGTSVVVPGGTAGAAGSAATGNSEEEEKDRVERLPPGYRPDLVPPDMELTPEGRPTKPL